MRLRYTGPVPVSFVALGLAVDPGDEFEIPDEHAPGLVARNDIDEVAIVPPRSVSRPRSKAADPAPAGGLEPAAASPMEVEADGVPVDH